MMDAFEGGQLLRLVIISGLSGFLIFCVSYSFSVWLRRNQTSKVAKTAMWRIGASMTVLGMVGLVVYWLSDQFTLRAGVVDGADLFVVHARREATIQKLAT